LGELVMHKTLVSLVLVSTLLVVANASAQAPAQHYDFEELVRGDLVAPLGETLNARTRGSRVTLIRERTQFVPEMLKSVENL
jgi:hypothetical protein